MRHPAFTLLIFTIIIFSGCSPKGKNLLLNKSHSKKEAPKTSKRKRLPIFIGNASIPRFPGCEDMAGPDAERQKCSEKQMVKFIHKYIQYPEKAQKNGVEGKVLVQFSITPCGKVNKLQIVKDIGWGCGAEVIRILNLMNELGVRWTPGSSRIPINGIKFILPVRFELLEEQVLESKKKSHKRPNPPVKKKQKRKVVKVVEQMPRFPGCEHLAGTEAEKKKCADKKMFTFIYKNLQYPAEAIEQKIEGQVVVQFVVEPNGYVSSPEIIKDIGGGCGAEAVRLILLMNKKRIQWTPSSSRGPAVSFQLLVPITFELLKD